MMATEIHTVPADTTISEDLTSVFDDAKRFYDENKGVVLVIGAIAVSILINRSILRRELRRLNFTAEFFPYDEMESLSFD